MDALLYSKIQPCLSLISFPVKVLFPFLGLIQVPPCNYLSCPSGLLWSGSVSDSSIVFHCLDCFEEYWVLKYSVECPQFEFTLYFFQLARATGFWKGYQRWRAFLTASVTGVLISTWSHCWGFNSHHLVKEVFARLLHCNITIFSFLVLFLEASH